MLVHNWVYSFCFLMHYIAKSMGHPFKSLNSGVPMISMATVV